MQQAGVVLPLSSNPRLDSALGTRHRAAIGITEETDAVALVVSEERGEISLCFHGNIARDLDPATLRKALLGLFFKEKRQKQRIAEEAQAAAAAAEAVAALAAQSSPGLRASASTPPTAPDKVSRSSSASSSMPGMKVAQAAPPEAG